MHRAHILAKKVSPRAFVEQPGKKGQATGEVGIEGTTIEAPDAVRRPKPKSYTHTPVQPGRKRQAAGEVGVEGTTIGAPDAVRCGR